MDIDLDAIPNGFEVRGGLPRPNWDSIWAWFESHVDEAVLGERWDAVVRLWLARLCRALQTGYEVYESDKFMLLSSLGEDASERILYWCESARRKTHESLPGLATAEYSWKWVVLAFADAESYYDFVADLYPEEGEFGASGGTCVSGFGQIILYANPKLDLERTVAHEIAHAQLSNLPLPAWLDEGVTQILEDIIVGNSWFLMTADIKSEHRQYWSEETISHFWSGNSFHAPDDGQKLSYSLAQVLVRNMIADHRKKFQEFLRAADWKDAGEAAAREKLGVSLADCVAQFLGPGNWRPANNYETIDVEASDL